MTQSSHTMSEVDSNLVILNDKLMKYVNVGMESTLTVAQDIAEYCRDDAKLKQMTQDIMRDFISIENDIQQNVLALNHIKSVGTTLGNGKNLLASFKDRLQELQRGDVQNFRNHPRYKEMEEAMDAREIDEQLKALKAMLVGTSTDDDVTMVEAEVNIKCPITGKTMVNPVRNKVCNHTYEKDGILEHINSRKLKAKCPLPGCVNPNFIMSENLEEDKILKKYITLLSKKQS